MPDGVRPGTDAVAGCTVLAKDRAVGRAKRNDWPSSSLLESEGTGSSSHLSLACVIKQIRRYYIAHYLSSIMKRTTDVE